MSFPEDERKKRKSPKNPGFDPIKQCTPEYIRETLRTDFNKGKYTNPAWAFDQFARLVPTLGDKVVFWKSQVAGTDWKIAVADDATGSSADPAKKALAEKQKEALRNAYENIINLKEAVRHLATARFYGYAALQREGQYLLPIKPWCVLRDLEWRGAEPPSQDWYFNPESKTALNKADMEVMEPEKFIVHEHEDPALLQLLGLAYDVLSFTDFRRVNLRAASKNQIIILTSQNLPPDDSPEMAALRTAIQKACKGESVALAKGDPSCPTEVHQSRAPVGLGCYDATLDKIDTQMTQVVTGGALTMLTAPTGMGSGVADTHQRTLTGLVATECEAIQDTLWRFIDIPVLTGANLLKEGERPLAWFEFCGKVDKDPMQGALLLQAIGAAGYKVSLEQAASIVGMELEEVQAEGEPGGGAGGDGGGGKGDGNGTGENTPGKQQGNGQAATAPGGENGAAETKDKESGGTGPGKSKKPVESEADGV